MGPETDDDTKSQLISASLKANDAQVADLKDALLARSWFGFDLDDTLHSFRKASKTASHAVFAQISKTHNVSVPDLAATYSEILARKTAGAFTDGRSSDSYRRERFRALLDEYGGVGGADGDGNGDVDEEYVARLAVLYKDALAGALEVKDGAVELIRYLRSVGKKVAVITEGPQDAQEWTLERLGFVEYVDLLVTTNKFGKAKVDGLFRVVMDHLKIEGEDMVYIGDSHDRDVLPARKEGIMTIHLSEAEDVVLRREEIRVNSLLELLQILRARND